MNEPELRPTPRPALTVCTPENRVCCHDRDDCDIRDPNSLWACSLQNGHDGSHLACGGREYGHNLATWTNDSQPEPEREVKPCRTIPDATTSAQSMIGTATEHPVQNVRSNAAPSEVPALAEAAITPLFPNEMEYPTLAEFQAMDAPPAGVEKAYADLMQEALAEHGVSAPAPTPEAPASETPTPWEPPDDMIRLQCKGLMVIANHRGNDGDEVVLDAITQAVQTIEFLERQRNQALAERDEEKRIKLIAVDLKLKAQTERDTALAEIASQRAVNTTLQQSNDALRENVERYRKVSDEALAENAALRQEVEGLKAKLQK